MCKQPTKITWCIPWDQLKTNYLHMKNLCLIVLVSIANFGFTQNKLKPCQTIILNNTTIKSCYHLNGNVSTVESWDEKKYWGKFIANKSDGTQLINYELRSIAGHASVYVSYHANGQIHKLTYSSAPDAGIQSYKYVHVFNEIGVQTEYYDYSMPDGYPTLYTTIPDSLRIKPYVTYEKELKKQDEKKQEVIECAAIAITKFVLINETKKKVSVKFNAQANLMYKFQDKIIDIKGKSELVVDSITFSNLFFEQQKSYKPEIISKNKEKFKLILAEKKEENQVRTYTWHIIEL